MAYTHELEQSDVSGSSVGGERSPGKRNLTERLGSRGSYDAADFTPASTGARLPSGLRGQFERSLGADLGEVRVHTDGSAAEAADRLGARAFAVGNDVFFGAGQYAPNSRSGQALLAHEVAHTVQSGGARGAAMTKLHVSSGSDASEAEADRAAQAMVTGQSFRVTPGIASGMISRHPHELPPIEIRDETLPDSVARDTRPWASAYDSTVTWGSGNTTTTDANGAPVARDTSIMRNAGENDSAHGRDDLTGLSQELDAVRPLMRQWILSNQSVNSIATNNGINPATPEAYRAEVVRALGPQTLQNPNSELGRRMAAELRGSSSQALQSAAAGVQASIARLQGVKNRLEAYRTRLQIAARRREVTAAEGELTRINETIHTIATVITTIAQVVAAASGAAAAASSAISGSLIEPPATLGSEVPGITSGTAGTVQSGANRVAGGGNVIETALRYTVFAERINGINSRISALNTQISGLTTVSERLDATAMANDLNEARSEYQQASAAAANAGQNFFNAMRMAGRAYDRRDMSERESGNVAGPVEGRGQTVSMEALLSLVATLQSRRAARESFGAYLGNSSYLRRAGTIADTALSGRRAGNMPLEGGGTVLARPPVDYDDPSQGFHADLGTQLEARSLRDTIGVLRGNISALDRQGAQQLQQETAWMNLVGQASGGLVH